MLGQIGATQAVKETGWSVSMGNLFNEIEELKNRIGILATRVEPFLNMTGEQQKNPSAPRPPKPKALEEMLEHAVYPKVPEEFIQMYSDIPSTMQALKEKVNAILAYLRDTGGAK